MGPHLPSPRGPLTDWLFETLAGAPGTAAEPPDLEDGIEALADEDLHLALYCAYELHYRGFEGVADDWEWDTVLLGLRARLEAAFEAALLHAVPKPAPVEAEEMDVALRALIHADDAPALSRRVETRASHEQFLELLVHRTAYLPKEADPHSFAVPRLTGPPKAAMVEILADEYGGGRFERMHSELFRQELSALGLEPEYGAYLEFLPGVTLATVNLMSLYGLHRRHRAAMAGHLAIAEMTSSAANRRYGNALRRLGRADATAYHDEHVVADAVHESIAAVDLAGGLARQDPALGVDALWGAACSIAVDAALARRIDAAWEAGESSLRAPQGYEPGDSAALGAFQPTP